jgi:hypothetical protein
LSWTIYMILAITLGLFGIDHLYMRSPFTALLKFIVNILTLGFWYFYDIITALTEGDLVKKYGVGTPFFPTNGIGAGMFSDDPDKDHAPWKFMGYSMASMFPFNIIGINNFVAGDKWGAMLKIWMTILFCFPLILFAPLGWCIAIAAGLYSIYVLLFDTESIFSKGAPSLFNRAPSNMGPIDAKGTESDGFFGATLKWLMGILKNIPIVGAYIKQAEEKYALAVAAAQTIKASTIDVAIAGADAAKTLAVDVPKQAVQAVAMINDGIQAKIGALPSPMELAQKKMDAAAAPLMAATAPLAAATATAAAATETATGVLGSAAEVAANPTKMLTKQMGTRQLMKAVPTLAGGSMEGTSIASMALMGILYGGLVLAIGNFLYIQYKKVKEDKEGLEVEDKKTGSRHQSELSDVPPQAS